MKKNMGNRILGFALSFGLVLGCTTPVYADVQKNETVQAESTKMAVNLTKAQLDAAATGLALNQSSQDALDSAGDIDYYKFTITEKGYFNIRFAPDPGVVPESINDGWNIEIYSENDLINPLRKAGGIVTAYESVNMPMKAGNYYVLVKAKSNWSDRWAPAGCMYHITAAFTKNDAWESEGNDTWQEATLISENRTYFGNMHHDDDSDWYKVNVTKAGTMQLSMKQGSDVSSEQVKKGWEVSLYDENRKLLKRCTCTDELLSSEYPFPKGEYYINVAPLYSYSYAPLDCTYELRVITKSSGSWETEFNDENKTADTIKVNKVYNGILHNKNDADWYKFRTEKNGYFKVDFAVENTELLSNYYGFDITVYDKNYNEIAVYDSVKLSYTGNILPYEKGTYYLKIKAAFAHDGIVDIPYKVKIAFKESALWESENNDTSKKADTVNFGKTYSGLLSDSSESDWFRFTVKNAGTIRITLKADEVNPDTVENGWRVYVYNKTSSNPVGKIEKITNKEFLTLDLKKGTYYIKVTGNYGGAVGCIYKLNVGYSQAPKKSVIKSIKSSGRKVTLKWNKSKNADGYEIYRSTSQTGTYKKIAAVKKNSTLAYTDKKSLKKGRTYYYIVIPYNKTNGVTAYAVKYNVKSIKVK